MTTPSRSLGGCDLLEMSPPGTIPQNDGRTPRTAPKAIPEHSLTLVLARATDKELKETPSPQGAARLLHSQLTLTPSQSGSCRGSAAYAPSSCLCVLHGDTCSDILRYRDCVHTPPTLALSPLLATGRSRLQRPAGSRRPLLRERLSMQTAPLSVAGFNELHQHAVSPTIMPSAREARGQDLCPIAAKRANPWVS